jgi:hypothetical protein
MATYGSDFLTGGTATARSYYQNDPQYAPSKACDDDTATRWAEGGMPVDGWWKYDLGSGVAKRANKISLEYHSSADYIDGFKLYGSDDDSTYTEVYSGTMTTNPQSFEFTNATSYRYYKIVLHDNTVNGYWFNIVEISLYEDSEQGGGGAVGQFLSTNKGIL